MSTGVRWVVIAACALLIVGLLIWARGPEHHRGSEVGATAQVAR